MTETNQERFYGGLWLNKNRSKENQPALTGKIVIEGKAYQIAVFKNQDRSNRKPHYNLVMQEVELKPVSAEELD